MRQSTRRVTGNWTRFGRTSSNSLMTRTPPKPLLLAAIGAVGSIRPAEAREILVDLADSDDEEIAEAIDEAMAAAKVSTDEEDNEEDEWVN